MKFIDLAALVCRKRSGEGRRVLRKTSGSDKDVDFRRAPGGDWDAYQSGGGALNCQEGTRKMKAPQSM